MVQYKTVDKKSQYFDVKNIIKGDVEKEEILYIFEKIYEFIANDHHLEGYFSYKNRSLFLYYEDVNLNIFEYNFEYNFFSLINDNSHIEFVITNDDDKIDILYGIILNMLSNSSINCIHMDGVRMLNNDTFLPTEIEYIY